MTLVIGDGEATGIAGWRIESAGPQDRDALAALFARCSAQSVRQRFFGRLGALPLPYLDGALAGPPDHHDAVVGHGGDRACLAGLASLVAEDPAGTSAELGVLVADACQRRGLGGAMMGVLLARARLRGVTRVTACVLPYRAPLLAALGRRPELSLVDGSVTRDARTGVYELR